MEQGLPPVGEIEEVYQEDPSAMVPLPVVEVKVSGPVQTHGVPSVSGGMRSFAMLQNEVKKLGGRDPRRRIMRILCDQNFWVGIDQNSVQSGFSAEWIGNVVCEITHCEEVWVKVPVDSVVSIIVENWAS